MIWKSCNEHTNNLTETSWEPKCLIGMRIPVCTLCPICRLDIGTESPFSILTVATGGKQPPADDDAGDDDDSTFEIDYIRSIL